MSFRSAGEGRRRRALAFSISVLLVAGVVDGLVALPASAATSTMAASSTSAGTLGNGASTVPDITPDGRYVAFVSAATNLVANDANAQPDVFVKDRQTGATVRASVATNGA